MLKLTGLLLIMAFCSLGGIWMAGTLKHRTQALKKTQLFLHMLAERLSYTLSPVDEIFSSLAREPLLAELDLIGLCREKLESGAPFPAAFRESVESCRAPLDARDRQLLCELAGIIGASDVENQLSGLRLVRANLAEQTLAAQDSATKRARLYSSLGVLSGLAVVIVLL